LWEIQRGARERTPLNQVGQTEATPRHPKGLSTRCHDEDPDVVGRRFINERRAMDLDPNCGWAREGRCPVCGRRVSGHGPGDRASGNAAADNQEIEAALT
jgi:hypothetical protein